jgi:hypothetical protein
MRNPQIETAEIADAELDAVSGGVATSLAGDLVADASGVAGNLSGGVEGVGGFSSTVAGDLTAVDAVTATLR